MGTGQRYGIRLRKADRVHVVTNFQPKEGGNVARAASSARVRAEVADKVVKQNRSYPRRSRPRTTPANSRAVPTTRTRRSWTNVRKATGHPGPVGALQVFALGQQRDELLDLTAEGLTLAAAFENRTTKVLRRLKAHAFSVLRCCGPARVSHPVESFPVSFDPGLCNDRPVRDCHYGFGEADSERG